jgi:hypothetical protein
MASTATPVTSRRQLAAWIGLALVGLVLISQAGRATGLAGALGLADYIAYWSAGHVNAHGGNPYSPETLLALQHDLGWPEDFPNMMYYPPWTLPLVMPFGVLPYALSRLVWLVLHLALILLAADRVWRFYGGAERYRLVAWIIALSFVPTLIVLRMGQIGPILLLGIVGFLEFERRGWDWLAGAALMLPAIKPQLVYLFGLAVVLWAVDRRRWRVLLGGGLTGLAALAIATAFNPHVLEQYRYALANPPSVNVTPTIGALLRLAFGAEYTWLQFLPTVVGMIWFPFYWLRHRRTWSWGEQAPILLFASFLTTAYGAWVFDLVVLLLPLLQAAVWVTADAQRRQVVFAVGTFAVIDAVALGMNLLGVTYPAFIWMAPTLLMVYLILKRQTIAFSREPLASANSAFARGSRLNEVSG